MGCCVSTKTTSPRHHTAASNGGSKSPPPLDEETVKEVLTETKLPPPPIPIFHENRRNGAHTNGSTFSTENDAAFRRPRSDSRPLPGDLKREKAAGRSPARRSDSSPGRVNSGSGYGRKVASGESSGRRSRSPVIRSGSGPAKSGFNPNRPWRKTGDYSGRIGFGSGEKTRKVEEEKEREEMTRQQPTTSNELLENSLVSLECFIFL